MNASSVPRLRLAAMQSYPTALRRSVETSE
jgi:hypothetical protein